MQLTEREIWILWVSLQESTGLGSSVTMDASLWDRETALAVDGKPVKWGEVAAIFEKMDKSLP